MTDTPSPAYLLIGEILRPHGVVGELKMRVLTAYPERLRELKTVFLADDPESGTPDSYTLDHVRFHHDYALIKLKEIPDRTAAERFRELFVLVAINDAIPLDEGEHYLFQLIGMTVETEAGESLGTLADVMETGANDVYVVESKEYGEVLIPATEHTILNTDTETRRITVRLPEGLLPDR
ncbi:MAG TPA: ribosome maturation factor RimM [Aggregatilineales bacterium]|nr:ribosome maturation factor RimM [Aggregatilineales bacterium]